MREKTPEKIDCRRVELDGVRYVILRETLFQTLCRKAHVEDQVPTSDEESLSVGIDLDRASLARKLMRRRLTAGLTQAELARRAGVRPETLNRIERGKTTPDYATIRKLVEAMKAAESEQAAAAIRQDTKKEINHVAAN